MIKLSNLQSTKEVPHSLDIKLNKAKLLEAWGNNNPLASGILAIYANEKFQRELKSDEEIIGEIVDNEERFKGLEAVIVRVGSWMGH